MATTNKAQQIYWRHTVLPLVKAQADEAQMSISAWVNQLVVDEQIRINNRNEREARKQLAQEQSK